MHGEAAPPRPVEADSVDLSRAPEDLPPLALSTNPLFPNAVVKRPPNTHARGPVPKPQQSQSPAPTSQPRLTGKNAPSTPQALTTRGSARRSLTTQDAAEAREAIGQQPMQVDEY